MAESVLNPVVKKRKSVLEPFFQSLFHPSGFIDSFQDPRISITVYAFSSPDKPPTRISLAPPPFLTLYDLKIMLYQKFDSQAFAHPLYQSLLFPISQTEELSESYTPFEYSWYLDKEQGELDLIDPFTRVRGFEVDTRFVTSEGKKEVASNDRSRILLEDSLSEQVVLHLFFYKDVVASLRPELRASEREWAGRITPYFPGVPQGQTKLGSDQEEEVKIHDTYVRNVLSSIKRLDEILESERETLLPMTVTHCKFLRIIWKTLPKSKHESLERIFYTQTATHYRPFMRILPSGAPPITKLKLTESLKIPEVSDPRLLIKWKDERNPKPDETCLIVKVMIRKEAGKGLASQPALYGTLRLYQDSSSEFYLVTPEKVDKLDVTADLGDLADVLEMGLEGLPIEGMIPEIKDASLVCGIRLPVSKKTMDAETLRSKLKFFAPLFQEIPALPGESPLLMLRYKAVSNYSSEDRMYTFLSQELSLLQAKGEFSPPRLTRELQAEFHLSAVEAEQTVSQWYKDRSKIQIKDAQAKDYILTYNPGTDIAIYAQQSQYTIHLYRVESNRDLQRILTCMSMIFSGSKSAFPMTAKIESQAATIARTSLKISAAPPGSDPAFKRETRQIPVEEEIDLNAEDTGLEGIYAAALEGAPTYGDEEEEKEEGDAAVAPEGEGEEEEKGESFEFLENNNGEEATAEAAPPVEAEPEAAAPVEAEPEAEAQEANVELAVPGQKKRTYQGWVKSKLQEYDGRLFQYKTDLAGRKVKKYVTMCQATESRQPYVLNQTQYEIMRDTYADSGVVFVVYGPNEPRTPYEPGDEVYTLLKYGTDPNRLHYYLCCQFFCTKDYILVREVDFYSTKDREGNPKPKGSCPFCHGLEIKVLKSPRSNETVIQRRTKKGDVKRHLYVSFLQGETQHPEGFYLPCCFTEDTTIYETDHRFDAIRKQEEKEEADEEEEELAPGSLAISYQLTLNRAHQKYIIGAEKEYLYLKSTDKEGPQIGLLPPPIDTYFGQVPKDFVAREGNKMELTPYANCFLRVAAENRAQYRYDSFLSALAPFIGYRPTAQAVKERIREVMTPLLFTSLNYGNLVLEFFNPSDPDPTFGELKTWAQEKLGGLQISPLNEEAVKRIYKSYRSFLGFLRSTDLKEYRQFAQLLALPNLLNPSANGLVLIVLDLNEKNELSIRCPPFGYNESQYATADIGFMLHRSSGIWEPIFYTENRPESAKEGVKHDHTLRFQVDGQEGWPRIVKQRVQEFRTQCRGLGRGVFTLSRGIDPMALIPVSAVMNLVRSKESGLPAPKGVIRDSYNHVAALVFRGKPGLIPLPVIDDEYNLSAYKLYLGWDDIEDRKYASIETILQFYAGPLKPLVDRYPGYAIKMCATDSETKTYIAVRLANGLFVRAYQPPKAEIPPFCKDEFGREKVVVLDTPEWEINQEIYWGMKKKDLLKEEQPQKESLLQTDEAELEEIFQHLRLTFSAWMGSSEVTDSLRETIKEISLDTETSLAERREKLKVLLGSTILSWMDDSPRDTTPVTALLRVDCRLQTQPFCKGKCVWRKQSEQGVERCYLHTPKEYSAGGRQANGRYLLMLRLLEELLRFPDRRNELLQARVPELVKLEEAVTIGDQRVLPEGSPAWYDLLRLDWMKSQTEGKKYLEEFSRSKN